MITLLMPDAPPKWAHQAWKKDRHIEQVVATRPDWYEAKLVSRLSSTPDGCLEWPGTLAEGYGMIWLPRGTGAWGDLTARVHRVRWLAERGPLALGWVPDHLCMNRKCTELSHLDPTPDKDNKSRWHATVTTCPAGHVLEGKRCQTCAIAISRVRASVERLAARTTGTSVSAYRRERDTRLNPMLDAIGDTDLVVRTMRAEVDASDLLVVSCSKGIHGELSKKALSL